MRRPRWLLMTAVVLAVPAVAACDPVVGIAVTTTADGVDAAPGDGACEMTPGGGDCSVRAAIQEAGATAPLLGRPQIALQPGVTYTLSIAGPGEDAGATGDLDVVRDLDLVGNGATLDAAGLDRVLDVRGDVDVSLSGLTITGGVATEGGGVRVAEAVTHVMLTDSWVTANLANGLRTWEASWGAYLGGGEGGGGGIANHGTLDVVRTTISANRSEGEVRCVRNLFWSCTWQGGGALYNAGTAHLVDATVAANAAAMGPAVIDEPTVLSSSTTVFASTIADNENLPATAPYPMQVNYGPLGVQLAITRTLVMGASVLAGSVGACGLPPGADELYRSLGYNVSEDSTCFFGGTDLIDTPAGLGPLADHGGQAPTRLPGAVLVDRIPPESGCLPVDQRGVARPSGAGCDVGAVERTPSDG